MHRHRSIHLGLLALMVVVISTTLTALAVQPTTAPSTAADLKSPTTAPSPPPASPASISDALASGGSLSDLSLQDLMNVDVTSVDKKKESITQAPAAVYVIDQDAINRSGFTTIPDLLRLAPGMDVARINSFTWAISSRGRNDQFADNLLVLQDGRTVYSPIDSGVHWDTVDYVLADLDRIEVIRGPGATLWGSNAVNGVINITSKDARDTQGWLVSALGSNDDSSLSARYGGKIDDDTFYRVYFKEKYDQGLPSGVNSPSGIDEADQWYSQRGGFRIDKHPSDSDSFTFQGDLANNQLKEPNSLPILTPPYVQQGVFNGSDTTGNLIGRWNHTFDADSDFSLQLYYDYLAISTGTLSFDTSTVDIDFHDRFKLGKLNEITWGAGYRFYRTETPDYPTIAWVPDNQDRNLINIFAQDTFSVVPDHFSFTFGSKLEHNDFTGYELEPSGRLMWTPDNRNSIWGSISRATRSPATVDTALRLTNSTFPVASPLGGTVPAAVVLQGNPDFASETEVAYELGYRMQATKTFSVDVSAYYNNYTHLQSIDTGAARLGDPVIIPVTFGNGAQGDTYGGEIAANWRVAPIWRLTASYSLLHQSYWSAPGSKQTIYPAQLAHSAPQHQAQLHSYLDITHNLHFNAALYFTSSVGEFDVPAYWSTDLNVMWDPVENLEMAVGVTNLFDNEHPEFGTTANQGYADQVPRTVYAELTYRF